MKSASSGHYGFGFGVGAGSNLNVSPMSLNPKLKEPHDKSVGPFWRASTCRPDPDRQKSGRPFAALALKIILIRLSSTRAALYRAKAEHQAPPAKGPTESCS